MSIHQSYTHVEPEPEVLDDSLPKEKQLETTALYNKIIDCLQDEKPWMDPDFNINDLAKRLMTNRTYISIAIKKGAGVNFHTLLSSFRINEAKKLLLFSADKSENIDEIMEKCGFRNRGTFNIAFNKNTGMSPGQFRSYSRLVTLPGNDANDPVEQ